MPRIAWYIYIRNKVTATQKGDSIMNITLDKENTTIALKDQVKADMKEFKARYTDSDLKRAFEDALDYGKTYGGDVLKADVQAFPSGWINDNATHFAVDMLVDNCIALYRIRFYCDMNLEVNTDPILVTIKEYRAVR